MQLTKSEQDKQTNSRNLLLATGKKIYNLCFPLSGQAQKYFPLLGQDVPWDISCSISSKVSIYPTPRIHISQSLKNCILSLFLQIFASVASLN